MSKLIKEAGTGCGRGVMIQVIAAAVGLPLFCLLILAPLAFVERLDLDPLWLALPGGLFLLLVLGGAPALLFGVAARRRRHLDAVCTPLGLAGSAYNFWFRQYHGEVGGREVAIYFYRGPAVEIDVETSLQTRLAVSEADADSRMLARLTQQAPLDPQNPEMKDLRASALDENWARALLDGAGVPALLHRLLAFPGAFRWRHIVLRPGAWRLTLFGSGRLLDFNFDVTADALRDALERLLELAQGAEALPAPVETAAESPAEGVARRLRARNPYLLPAITAGLLLLFVCLASGIAAVGVYLASGS